MQRLIDLANVRTLCDLYVMVVVVTYKQRL